MLASPLPANPSLEQLRKKAKELRDLVRTGHPKFTGLVRELHPRPPAAGAEPDWAGFTLSDAQLVIARMHGFANWRRLREHPRCAGQLQPVAATRAAHRRRRGR